MAKKNFDPLVKGVREMKGHISANATDFLQLTDEKLGVIADAATAAANRASDAIDDVLTIAEASNKRIAAMEAKAGKKRKAR